MIPSQDYRILTLAVTKSVTILCRHITPIGRDNKIIITHFYGFYMARNKTIQKKKDIYIMYSDDSDAKSVNGETWIPLCYSCSAHYTKLADMLHERERDIKAARQNH